MYTPKLAPLMATGEIIKPARSSDKGAQHRRDEWIRRCLLCWASLRLVVSVLWTGVLEIMSWQYYKNLWYQRESNYYPETPAVLTFAVVALIAQLVEFGMLVTFICAGVKKSASLYRAYYRYCILTLIIYIIAVTLCLVLVYEIGHYFGEIYITYNFNDIWGIQKDDLIFGVTAIFDICLEIWLIRLTKRFINKYSNDEDKNITNCENV